VARALFRNRKATAIWIFMAIWMTFLCLMTWVLFRDGPPPRSVADTVMIALR